MRITGLGPQLPEQTGTPGIPSRLTGVLTLGENGRMLLRTEAGEWPVRLLGAELPLGQTLAFRVVGTDENSLILSSIKGEVQRVDRWKALLQEWGLGHDDQWKGFIADLFKEDLPITKDNLLSLERNLRMVRQEWGIELKPRVLAFMMSRNIPVRPQTVLALLYRLYPDMRQRIAEALEEFKPQEIAIGSPETIERSLQDVLTQPKPAAEHDNNSTWQAVLGSVVYKAGDQGEIHWPSKDSEEGDIHRNKRFGFDLLPPYLGLVEVRVDWSPDGSRITFIVDPQHLEAFNQELPKWQSQLAQDGLEVVAFAKAAEADFQLPPVVDRTV